MRGLILGLSLAVMAFLPSVGLHAEDSPTLMQPKQGIVAGVSEAPEFGGNLLVLKVPKIGTPSLGAVHNGQEVTIEEVSGLWMRISAPKEGWVWGSYIKITGSEPAPGKGGPQDIDLLSINSTSQKRHDYLQKGQKFFPEVATPPAIPPASATATP